MSYTILFCNIYSFFNWISYFTVLVIFVLHIILFELVADANVTFTFYFNFNFNILNESLFQFINI